MLERTSVVINDKEIEVRIEVGMPAAGRKILGKAAAHTLINGLPKIVVEPSCIKILIDKHFNIK